MRLLSQFFVCLLFIFISNIGFTQENSPTPNYLGSLHAILFADTQMESFGTGIETSYYQIKDELTNIAQYTNLKLATYDYLGDDFTKENLQYRLNNLEVASNDVVVFYYIGDGFRYENQQNKWQHLYLDKGEKLESDKLTSNSIHLSQIHKKLKNTSARLVLTIADAGHSKEYVTQSSSKKLFDFQNKEQRTQRVDKDLKSQYEYLFLRSKGSVLMSGCSPDQLAEIDPHPNRGSIFSWGFAQSLSKSYEQISWNQLLKKAEELTLGFFIGSESFQTPMYAVDLEQSEANTKPVAVKPQLNAAPKIWAIFVGISKYANPDPNLDRLKYTDDDAYLLYSFYKSPEGGALPDEQISVLVDENATQEAILAELNDKVKKANEQDIILFYFSGHGVKGALLPYDHYPNKKVTQLSYSTIKAKLAESKAKKRMVISDACYAGTLMASRGGSLGSAQINAFYQKMMEAEEGTILMASSRAREYSKEFDGLRQGVFSYFMIEGLKGKADAGNRDGIINIKELFNYVKMNVRKRTDGDQNPIIYGDFDPETPLANINRKKEKSPLKVWAVIVGVSAYQTFSNLDYADDDAYLLNAFFKSPQGGALPDEQIKILVDQNATRDRIEDALKTQFAKASRNDLVVFYYAGHANEKAFFPYDYDGTANRLMYDNIKAIFKNCPANKKLWIADACHSGGIKGTPNEVWKEIMAKQRGTALLMSSRKEQKSYERNDLRQGIFSHYLIKGLKGHSSETQAKRGHPDCDHECKFVTISELFRYIRENVAEETNNTQRPDIDGDYDRNMPVGWVGVRQ